MPVIGGGRGGLDSGLAGPSSLPGQLSLDWVASVSRRSDARAWD